MIKKSIKNIIFAIFTIVFLSPASNLMPMDQADKDNLNALLSNKDMSFKTLQEFGNNDQVFAALHLIYQQKLGTTGFIELEQANGIVFGFSSVFSYLGLVNGGKLKSFSLAVNNICFGSFNHNTINNIHDIIGGCIISIPYSDSNSSGRLYYFVCKECIEANIVPARLDSSGKLSPEASDFTLIKKQSNGYQCKFKHASVEAVLSTDICFGTITKHSIISPCKLTLYNQRIPNKALIPSINCIFVPYILLSERLINRT